MASKKSRCCLASLTDAAFTDKLLRVINDIKPRIENEKNISAQKEKKSPKARFSKENADKRRSDGFGAEKKKGAEKTECKRVGKFMLPAKHRLKSKKEFNEVFRRGKTISNDVFLLKCRAGEPEELKIGFSVGVKFSKKVPERNKAKRWMREAVRPMVGKIKPGHQIIFLINSKFPYKQINHALIGEKMEDLLGKAKLFRQ